MSASVLTIVLRSAVELSALGLKAGDIVSPAQADTIRIAADDLARLAESLQGAGALGKPVVS